MCVLLSGYESLFGEPGVALSHLTWVWICLLGSGEKQSWERPALWGPKPLIQSLTVLWLADGLRQASSCSLSQRWPTRVLLSHQ